MPSTQSSRLKEIGGFVILNKLGQGGMGAVFKARQKSLDRVVALKVLPPSIAKDMSFIERFQREARASAKLNHPNIVQGIDVGQDEETRLWYFAMELVEGPTVLQVLKEKKVIPEDRALEIIREVARALECIERHGMVHRDIKPDNILLTNKGEAKLADLGLAKQLADDASMTQAGQTVGTPHYISPEQARGQADQIDIRTDIYALGATLFHMVTGRPPFDGPTGAVIMSKHLTETAPKANTVNEKVSESCSKLIFRMMQKKREQRHRNATELLEHIEKVINREATTGPRRPVNASGMLRSEQSGRLPAASARRPVSQKILMGVAGVIMLGVIVGLALGGSADEAPRKAAAAKKDQPEPPKPQPAATPPAATPSADPEEPQAKAEPEKPRPAKVHPRKNDDLADSADLVESYIRQKNYASARSRIIALERFVPKDESGDEWRHKIEGWNKQLASGSKAALDDLLKLAQTRADAGNIGGVKSALSGQRITDLLNEDEAQARKRLPKLLEIAEKAAKANAEKASVEKDEFAKLVATLPVEQQREKVLAKMRELNPEWPPCKLPDQAGKIVSIGMSSINLKDVSPLRALPDLRAISIRGIGDKKIGLEDISGLAGLKLTHFTACNTQLEDISPLKGMPLTNVNIDMTNVTDISPLKGAPIAVFNCHKSPVASLEPLRGAPLSYVDCYGSEVTDLSPLAGSPIDQLRCHTMPKLTDFSPLKDCPKLRTVYFDFAKEMPDAAERLNAVRAVKTLTVINGFKAAEFFAAGGMTIGAKK